MFKREYFNINYENGVWLTAPKLAEIHCTPSQNEMKVVLSHAHVSERGEREILRNNVSIITSHISESRQYRVAAMCIQKHLIGELEKVQVSR